MIKTKEELKVITENNKQGEVSLFLSDLSDFEGKNIPFEKFYLSQNRKVEFDSAIKISQKVR